ncbi:MAG: hypothetical protein FJW69_10185, partial [Actinobacteria bacterium]|nr:hypothetical protein [Actinomycetota bacterium]
FMLTGFGRAEFLNAAAMSYRGLAAILPVIVFAPVYGRLSMLLMFSVHEPANPESSLSTAFRDKSNREVFILSFIYISVLFVAVCMFSQVVLFNSVIVPAFATPSGSSAGQAGNSGFLLSRFLFAGPVYGSGSGTETGANLVVGPVSDLLIDHWTGFIFIFFALKAIIVIISTLLFTAAAGKFFARRLKGITGDVIGGVCVLTEIFFLFANYIAIRLL